MTAVIVLTSLHPPRPCTTRSHNVHRTLPTPTLLTITWTQVLWFLESLTRPTVTCCVTTRTRLTVCLPVQPQCIRGVLDPPVSGFSLSLYRHPILRMICPLFLILLVRLGDYIVNLCDCYFYKLIGKLTAFLEYQEFILYIQTVDFSTTVVWRSPPIWNQRLKIFLLRLWHYGLFWI